MELLFYVVASVVVPLVASAIMGIGLWMVLEFFDYLF